jgi:hypothetical protein
MKLSNPIQVGVFERYTVADAAVSALLDAGFSREAISVICPTCSADQFEDVEREAPAGAHTPKAAATGGAIGGTLGGLTAAAGILASGGTALLVVGPLLAATAVGAVAGAFIGAMSTRGFEPEIADFYDQALRKGQILVAVDTQYDPKGPDKAVAERVLSQTGALSVSLPRG